MSLDSCKVSENIPTDREDNFAVVAGKRGKELSQQLSKSDMIFHFDEAEVSLITEVWSRLYFDYNWIK